MFNPSLGFLAHSFPLCFSSQVVEEFPLSCKTEVCHIIVFFGLLGLEADLNFCISKRIYKNNIYDLKLIHEYLLDDFEWLKNRCHKRVMLLLSSRLFPS